MFCSLKFSMLKQNKESFYLHNRLPFTSKSFNLPTVFQYSKYSIKKLNFFRLNDFLIALFFNIQPNFGGLLLIWYKGGLTRIPRKLWLIHHGALLWVAGWKYYKASQEPQKLSIISLPSRLPAAACCYY